MFKNIIKRIYSPLKRILTKKLRRKIKYRSVKKAKDILKEVDERINNENVKTAILKRKEEKRKMEIEILREIINETPNFYTEEEFKIILEKLHTKNEF